MKVTANKLIIAIPVVLLAVAGGYVAVKGVPGMQPAPQAAPAAAPAESRANFEKRFEDTLNDFLRTVNEKAQDYKKQRKVVMEIVKPQNLTRPEDVKENFKLMQTTIPQMEQKMEDIMADFRDTETKVRALADERPEDTRQAIMDSWRAVRDKQASLYLAFFASEQDILQAYADLMSLYNEKAGTYSYDDSTGALLFQDPADKQAESDLRDKIRDLERKQSDAMRDADTEQEPTETNTPPPPGVEENAAPPPVETLETPGAETPAADAAAPDAAAPAQ